VDVNKLPFLDHLAELRKRLFLILAVVLVATTISYVYVQPIMENIISLAGEKVDFIYISPPELFLAYIKLSIVAGVTITFPLLAYQIYSFIRPGLEKRERRVVIISLLGGTVFFILGILFSYNVVLPIVLKFFLDLRIGTIEPVISVGNYISFVSTSLLSFGIVFEMPMLIMLLSRFGIVSSSFLQKNTKHIIFGIVVVAAFLTPPDVVSQALLAGPMIILYEISILLAKLVERNKNKDIAQVDG